jgi:NCS1 family nucleobase:cation symporter-1
MLNMTPDTDCIIRGIECHSIDYVPATERHGNVRDQGPFWFTGNFQFLTISIGFIGPAMGLSFFWKAVSAILGIMFGTLFMALHATQGPILGPPQMVQSRAQFGFRGVIVPLFGTLVNYAGFNVICALLLMAGLHHLFGWNQYLVLAATAIPSVTLAVYGYDWLHRCFKILFWISVPLLAVLTPAIAFGAVAHPAPPKIGFNLVAFGIEFAACASYNIAYAPYVSDYSRYFPRETKASTIIMNVFWGTSLSGTWLVVLGAWVAIMMGASDPLVALNASGNAVFPHFGTFLVIDSVAVLFALIAVDNYSGMVTLVTAVDSFKTMPRTCTVRTIFVALVTLLWAGVAVLCGQSAMTALGLVLTIVLYLLIPWTSVNLVDFFFVRRGHYAVTELLRAEGIYGNWAWRGLLAYALGWAAILPFAVLPGVWTGQLAAKIGGVDISRLMGLLAAGVSYYLMAKGIAVNQERTAVISSETELGGYAPAPGE